MRALPLFLTLTLASCATATNTAVDEHDGHDHGHISALTAASDDPTDLCEHRVPADVCVQCHPELAARFKAVKDWCGPHSVPESQCHACHPDLQFEPLPELAEHADLAEVPREAAMAGLAQHAVPGKVTVVDFYAVWCVPCRNFDAQMYGLLNQRKDLAMRKIQIEDWEDPLAAKYLGGSPSLPYIVVFDKDGNEVGTHSGPDTDELSALLAEASGP